MSVELRGGPEQLARISRQLKEEANRGLQRELTRALTEATKPLKDELRKSARSTLPSSGGLAERIAGSRFGTRRVVKGNQAGVRLTATNKHGLMNLDRGRLRHPVFADSSQTRDEWTWVTQRITPGWWTQPLKAGTPEAGKKIEEAIGRVSDRIERAGRGLA